MKEAERKMMGESPQESETLGQCSAGRKGHCAKVNYGCLIIIT